MANDIDLSQVQWDDDTPDLNAVVWDDQPTTSQPPKLSLPQRSEHPARKYSTALETARSGLRGLTLGASDVIGAGVAAGAASMSPDVDFGDAYTDIKTELSADRDAFREQEPYLALGSEIGGSVAPMVLALPANAAKLAAVNITQGAGRAAPIVNAISGAGKTIASAPYVGKVVAPVGQGLAVGGVYGGTQADVGDEIGGAGEGMLYGAGTQYGINKLIGAGGRFASNVKAKGQAAANKYLLDNQGDIYNTVTVMLSDKGIDIQALAPQVRDEVMQYAAKALASGKSPDSAVAIANQAILQRLPKPPQVTSGTLNRDYIQQEKEGLLASGSQYLGADVRKTLEGYPNALIDNMQIMQRNTKGEAIPLEIKGKELQDFTQRASEKSMKNVKALYKDAEDNIGDTLAGFDDNFMQFIAENRGVEGISSLVQYAKNLGALKVQKNAQGVNELVAMPVNFKTMQKLRAKASSASKDMGMKGHDAGVFKSYIDDVFEQQGGELYRTAAAARRAHALQFESGPRVISDMLVSKARSETDKALGFQQVMNNVVLSPTRGADDMKKLFTFLVKDPETRAEGVQQIKNIRMGMLEHLLDKATAGQAKFSPAALNNAIKSMGGESKIKSVLGNKGYSELMNYKDAADILLNREKSVLQGSQTASRGLLLAEALFKKLESIPVVGGAATALGASTKVVSNVNTARKAKKAVNTDALTRGLGINALIDDPAISSARKAAIMAANREND